MKYYKKMLYLSWVISNDKSIFWEMEAYKGLALTNFYLGKVAKSDYYHDRYLRGKTENN
jgi:hypothetical protein